MDGRFDATVRDDGVGFAPAASAQTPHSLAGMRFRVEAEGGALAVASAPARGTLIRLSPPASAVSEQGVAVG